MNLSIIIVNYNVKYFLEQCLHSVMKAAVGISHEILVVDNASTDGSRDWLEKEFPEIIFTWNKHNLGFAKANNQALMKASGEYILFLNPDTILPEDCFQKCLHYFAVHPEAGALGVCMLDGSGNFLKESKRGFPAPLTAFYKLTGLATLFPASPIFSRYHMGHLDPEQNHETDVLAGAFMMVRKKVLEITGGFDESFFMYGEDIDLSYRIQQAGFKNIYFAECPILHFKGESTRKGTLNYVRMFYGAMAIFTRKHYGGMSAGLFSFCIHLAIWTRAFLSAAGYFIRYILKGIKGRLPKRSNDQSALLIAGSLLEIQRVENILQKSGGILTTPYRFITAIKEEPDISQSAALMEQLKKLSATEIIFCENGFQFREIIDYCRLLPGNLQIRISAHKSNSIVGSNTCIAAGDST
jgi:GT2 family glycosyltransferase